MLAAEAEEPLAVLRADGMAAADPRDTGVPGRRVQSLETWALGELPGERVLATAGPDDADSHAASLLAEPEIFREAAARLLVAGGKVERVRVLSAVGRREHDSRAAERGRLGFRRFDQRARNSAPPETLSHHERDQAGGWPVLLEQVLRPNAREPGELSPRTDLGDEHSRRRFSR